MCPVLLSASEVTVACPSNPAVIGPRRTEILPVYSPSPRSSVNSAPGMHWTTDGTSWKNRNTVSALLATWNSCVIFISTSRSAQHRSGRSHLYVPLEDGCRPYTGDCCRPMRPTSFPPLPHGALQVMAPPMPPPPSDEAHEYLDNEGDYRSRHYHHYQREAELPPECADRNVPDVLVREEHCGRDQQGRRPIPT